MSMASPPSGRQSPSKRTRTAVGKTNRSRGSRDEPPTVRSQTPALPKPQRLPEGLLRRSNTPSPMGTPSRKKGQLVPLSSGRSYLSTPKVENRDKLGRRLSGFKDGGENVRRLDRRHGGGQEVNAREYSLDASGNVALREHGDLVGKYEWDAENPEDFIHMDQGNFNEVPKTPDADEVFGVAAKKYEATKKISVVNDVKGKLQDALTDEELAALREKSLATPPAKGVASEKGDATTRSVDSMGSVVGRDAQAEKLRIRALEEKLRFKLQSMVPGKNELQRAFKFFDCDDSGCVDAAEFRKVFKQLNVPLEMDEARYLFEKYDDDESGKVEYYEFMKNFIPPDTDYNWRDYSAMGRTGFDRVHPDLRIHKMIDLLRNDVGPRRLARYFDRLGTKNEAGKLNLLQFIEGMTKEGYRLTSKQWQWMLELIDKDKSGFISADEFCWAFGTDDGNKEILNGPGEDNTENVDIFFVARDAVLDAEPVRMRTQGALPSTVMPADCDMAKEKVDLDADMTTCQDAVKGLKLDFKAQKVSMNQFFRQFDVNGSGWISRSEFDKGLRKMGYELSESEIRHMIRCFGVKEWDEGLTEGQFEALITDDICDDYSNVRGDVNDGRSAIKMGNTSHFPKRIQPDNGDVVLTPKGTKHYMKLDPLMRTKGPGAERRKAIYTPSPTGNSLHPARKRMVDPTKKGVLDGDEGVRKCLASIQDMIQERGLKGAFEWLDGNSNRFLTPDDLMTTMHKERITENAAEELCKFMDHNGDGNVSYKDFMTTMAECATQIPDNHPDMGQMTNTLIKREKMTPEMRYTSRWDDGIDPLKLNVPHRYSSRRRFHENPDGIVGVSTMGAAGCIIPRSDSPAFQSEQARHVRKSAPWEGGMGKVSGWQQDLVEADHDLRRTMGKARSRHKSHLRNTQQDLSRAAQQRIDDRFMVTEGLRSKQKFRYFRTVFDPAYE